MCWTWPTTYFPLTTSNFHRVESFLLKFCTRFLLINVYKRVFGIFCFVHIFSYLQKLKKTWFLHTHKNQVFNIFITIQDLNVIKNNPEHLFVDLDKWETWAKFQQKKGRSFSFVSSYFRVTLSQAIPSAVAHQVQVYSKTR